MDSHPATRPKTRRSMNPQTVPQPWAAAKSTAWGSTANHGARTKAPAVWSSQPRKRYSSAADCNGTRTVSMAREARNVPHPTHALLSSEPLGSPGRKNETTTSSAVAGRAARRHQASHRHRSRPVTDDTVPAGRRPGQSAASRTSGRTRAMYVRSSAVPAIGPKSTSPSGSSG